MRQEQKIMKIKTLILIVISIIVLFSLFYSPAEKAEISEPKPEKMQQWEVVEGKDKG